ncbi:NlpC/P60 family protein [Dorea formicigenerans]|uniref:C40 family peptidase n=1 Tax=Dorea formicigenerans TaxID=39486 RepID=UPI0032C0C7DD
MKVRVVRALIASAAVSTIFVTTAFVTPVFAEPENQVETLENQKSEVEAQADSINSQLVSLLVSYKALQQDIENQQVRIGEVGQDLAVAQENEQKQYEDMKLRIKYMYENGDASFAEAILTATSYSDLVNKSEYVEKVHGYDRNKLMEYVQTKEEVANLKTELEGEQADMEVMAQEMSSQQANLESTLTQMRAQIADFDSQLASAQAEADAKVARMQEEQQIAQSKSENQVGNVSSANQTGSAANTGTTKPTGGNATSSTGNTTPSTGNTGTTKPAGGNTTPPTANTTTPSTGNTGTATPSTGNAGTTTKPSTGSSSNTSKPSNASAGQKIANKGCEYIGNPYVYGGNSLTNGIDCSGFVQQIHAKFGISTPRNSTSLRYGGKAVAVSDMMPGDVVCYEGHVAIYIGGGQIVHASNSKPYPAGGIKTSNAYYRTIVAVRRYW